MGGVSTQKALASGAEPQTPMGELVALRWQEPITHEL